MQSKILQVFIYNFDDYGFQFMQTPNSKSQKMLILHEINKNRF